MAVQPLAKWQDLLDMLAARERQLEIARSAIAREFLNPYWERADLEQVLLESVQQRLAELPTPYLESMGSVAIQTTDYATGDALPQGALMAVAARMQVQTSDTVWVPAQRLNARAYFQALGTPATITPLYAFLGGGVLHNGHRLHLTLLVEPQLADLQADKWVLPPTGDEEAIVDRAHRWLNLEDFMQLGRI